MSHNSMHWTNDRAERNAVINMLGGVGNPIFEAVVDKGHPAGPERHIVTDNAIITIKNLYTNKMVTRLIATPGQLKRYGKPIPQAVMQKAIANVRAGLNH